MLQSILWGQKMSINGISQRNLNYLNTTYNNNVSDAVGASGATGETDEASLIANSGFDSLSFSKPAELFSNLQKLKISDPEKCKKICTEIASKLNAAAEENKGGKAEGFLLDMAKKFQSVADGGDISQLRPKKPTPPAGLAQVMYATSAYSKNQNNSIVDFLSKKTTDTKASNGVNEVMTEVYDLVCQAVG